MLRVSRLRVVLTVVVAALTVADASARTIRRSCRDGTSVRRAERSGQVVVACDVDTRCDGACAFEVPVCGPDSCQTETFTVPAGGIRRERLSTSPGAAPARLVLRCRPTAGCGGSSTTTGGPGTAGGPRPFQATTSTSIRPVRPSTTSSSTTTITSSTITSTTLIIRSRIPCFGDVDCNGLATACAVGFCDEDGFCAQECICRTPDFGPTCFLELARPCLVAGECVGPDDPDPTCRVCYLNLCRNVLVPACVSRLPADTRSSGSDVGVTVDFGLESGTSAVFGQ